MQGQNPTRVIQSALNDREAFYRDPAVRLTTSDLDALNGAEGAPMSVEHNRNDVVGSVHYSSKACLFLLVPAFCFLLVDLNVLVVLL